MALTVTVPTQKELSINVEVSTIINTIEVLRPVVSTGYNVVVTGIDKSALARSGK